MDEDIQEMVDFEENDELIDILNTSPSIRKRIQALKGLIQIERNKNWIFIEEVFKEETQEFKAELVKDMVELDDKWLNGILLEHAERASEEDGKLIRRILKNKGPADE